MNSISKTDHNILFIHFRHYFCLALSLLCLLVIYSFFWISIVKETISLSHMHKFMLGDIIRTTNKYQIEKNIMKMWENSHSQILNMRLIWYSSIKSSNVNKTQLNEALQWTD